jgi:hypothetical protein
MVEVGMDVGLRVGGIGDGGSDYGSRGIPDSVEGSVDRRDSMLAIRGAGVKVKKYKKV